MVDPACRGAVRVSPVPEVLPPLTAWGHRVWVGPVRQQDVEPYRRAVLRSRDRVSRWNPVDPSDLERHLRYQSSSHRTFMIHAREPTADHDIVGRINVTNVLRGRSSGAAMGYDAYDPYAGNGLFAEGLRLVVDLVLTAEPTGMGLHRLEASVQPGNVRSAGVLRSLGFRRRGLWPRYLWLPDEQGRHQWRDHVLYGITAEDWPVPAFDLPMMGQPVVVLAWSEGSPGRGTRLARELSVPLISAQMVSALGAEGMADLLGSAPGAVIEPPEPQWGWQGVVAAAGLDPRSVVVVDAATSSTVDQPRVACAVALQAHRVAGGWDAERG
ncbi:hypothetical protein KEM60_02031 [Austwickia sp. TVS 96-490-7B]|uniref:GNAT family N-acetyltransferase n=1 Tax=Austwickia sp. TVS 96-490-7B TaxID=2830843 RepID=UPI001E060BF2|nr:GNAT family protein [Austwickia sp. TVS 96-490-7B]MBW3085820.1 hypothetical protein [Austwickia sp. TVS 96-490-7B]